MDIACKSQFASQSICIIEVVLRARYHDSEEETGALKDTLYFWYFQSSFELWERQKKLEQNVDYVDAREIVK